MWVRFPPGTPVLSYASAFLQANRQFDLNSFERDWAAWPGQPSDDLMMRSQFNLFHDIGSYLFGRNLREAFDYAMYFVEQRKPMAPVVNAVDGQRCLPFGLSTAGRLATVLA
jgi:hypothetical protein